MLFKVWCLVVAIAAIREHCFAQWVKTSGPTGSEVVHLMKVSNYYVANAGPGGIYRSSDNGLSWSIAIEGLPNAPSVYGLTSSGSTLYACAAGQLSPLSFTPAIYRSTDLGASWTLLGNSATQRVYGTTLFADGDDLFVLSSEGGYYYSGNGGLTWTKSNSELKALPVRKMVVSNNRLFASAGDSEMYYSDNKGLNWTKVNDTFSAVGEMAAADNTIYVVCDGGIRISHDYGATWDLPVYPLPLTNTHYYRGIYAVGDAVYLPASDSIIVYSLDEGQHWTIINSDTLLNFHDAIVESGGTLMLATKAGMYFSPDLGTTWEERNNGLTSSIVKQISATGSTVAAATTTGIFFSSDNGSTWVRRMNGTYAGDNAFLERITSGVHLGVGNQIMAMSGIIEPARLLKSSNNGTGWTSTLTLGINKFISVLGGSGKIVAGVAGGVGVFVSYDDGETWALHASPLFRNISPNQIYVKGDTIAVSGFSQYIYISKNKGVDWQQRTLPDYSPSLTGFKDKLYIATIEGFYKSTDLGVTWTKLGALTINGVFNSLATDSQGRLFGVSDMGGVYVSFNEGAAWQPIPGMEAYFPKTIFISNSTIFLGTYGSGVFTYPLDKITLTVGLPTKKKSIPFTLYPNPVINGTLNIVGESEGPASVEILDMMGRSQMSTELCSDQTQINLGNLSAGLYLVKIKNSVADQAEKIIVR